MLTMPHARACRTAATPSLVQWTCSVDGDVQPLEPPQVDPPVPHWLADHASVREAPDERPDRHLGLEPGERRTEAVVRSAAERQVLRGAGAPDVEVAGGRPPL